MKKSDTYTTSPNPYSEISAAAARADGRPIVALSDFDYTLCGSYTPVGRNHVPNIDPKLVSAAQGQNLVIATGRRANNPAVPYFWRSGLLPAHMPAITENGGCLVFYDNDELSFLDLISPGELGALEEAEHYIKQITADEIPDGQVLVLKKGRTMLLAQLQSRDKLASPNHLNQEWLVDRLGSLVIDPTLQVVDTLASVTVQHRTVDKAGGFATYLDLAGIDRRTVYVAGFGDGPNDEPIFEESDFTVGFSPAVKDMVDIQVEGPHVAHEVFRALGAAASKTG